MTVTSPRNVETEVPGRPIPVLTASPEFDFLLACCSRSTEHSQAMFHDLAPCLNATRMVELAEQHGVIPQVYSRVAGTGLLAAEPLTALRQEYENNARRALGLTQELLRVIEHLKSRDITALAHKGPALAELLYANVADRQFSDLDVLVQTADVRGAKKALAERGYSTALSLTERQERAYLASGYEYEFDLAPNRNLLEIQWRILPRFYAVNFDMAAAFDRAVPVKLAGRTVMTLCPEDLMLDLCVHAAKHVWAQLSWLCDIAALAERPMDWSTVEREARRLGVERIVASTFALTDTLLGTNLATPAFCGSIPLNRDVVATMSAGADYDVESLNYFRLMLRLRERWQDRLRFLWRLLFTPSVGEWRAVRLPDALFPLYRVVRLFRLAGRMLS